MNIVQKTLNQIQSITAEVVSNAKSGHMGISMGASTIMYALMKDHYFFDIKDHKFFSRDRLVLSAGHSSALYYTCAHLFDMGVTEQDLRNYRKLGSKTPGHPEVQTTSFAETSTGPLGQGIANAVGMAIGQAMLGERFNVQKAPVLDNYVYCLCGDGCLMEGVANEAISLAGTLKLNKLILLYDCNNITIDGSLRIANTENVAKKFKAMNWTVITVSNGNSYRSVTKAIAKAKRNTNKPTIVIFKTKIGFKTEQEGISAAHGKQLSPEELEKFKEKLGVTESFKFSPDVKEYALRTVRTQRIALEKWNRMFVIYSTTHPELYKQLNVFMEDRKIDCQKLLKSEIEKQDMSGRDANALILKELSSKMPRFVGGTGDVGPSSKAYISGAGDFAWNNYRGKNIHFGVREHAMGAICNGLCLYLQNPVFCTTFLGFSNYMIPPIRMSALMNLPVIYTFTHDSFRIGQDGPTHQPVEQLGALRLIPNLNVLRPCDNTELLGCYQIALSGKNPSALLLSKQSIPHNPNSSFKLTQKGGYVISGAKGDVVIYATGSEVALAMEVKEILEQENITCVVASFPCLEVFENQTANYKNSVLDSGKLRVSLEASNDNVWFKYLRQGDLKISVEDFGASASAKELEKMYNFVPNVIARKIKNKLKNVE